MNARQCKTVHSGITGRTSQARFLSAWADP